MGEPPCLSAGTGGRGAPPALLVCPTRGRGKLLAWPLVLAAMTGSGARLEGQTLGTAPTTSPAVRTLPSTTIEPPLSGDLVPVRLTQVPGGSIPPVTTGGGYGGVAPVVTPPAPGLDMPAQTVVPVFPVPPPPPSSPLLVVPESTPRETPGRMIETPAAAAGDVDSGLPEPLDDGDDILDAAIETRGQLRVTVGRSKVFRLKRPIARALVDNPRVADIQLLDSEKPDPRLINLYGLSFGRATVTLWDQDERPSAYEVLVEIDEKELEQKIADVIPGSNVTVRQVAQQVILEGQVSDIQMMTQVVELVQSELRLTGQASVGSLAGAVGVGSSGNLSGGTGGAGGTTVQYQGGQGQSPLGVANVGNAQPGLVIVNRVRVPGPRQVMLKVKIAELNRTAMRQLGVSWLDTRNNAILGSTVGGAATLSGVGGTVQNAAFSPLGLVPGSIAVPAAERMLSAGFQPVSSIFDATAGAAVNSATTLFGIFNAGEFNLFINALRTNSLAKILAEPNLMTMDGQPAFFQAGGQFPYPVPQAATAGGGSVITIQFANFGAILEFLPMILPNEVIRLDVAPTFSELNFGAGFAIPGAGTVPGINERRARTVVELREGQTLAIAGLLSTRTNATTTRIPGLGDIPIVGPWFSRNSIETVETELVVLVTPELVEPLESNEVPPAPGDRVLEPNDWEFFFLGRIEGKTGHPYRSTVEYQDPLDVMKHFQSESRWVVGPHGHSD